ncbi:MAG: hypothetical protein Q7J27_02670 [Syntrophales bacterium]|nr:hypothetical protein [Syntrophales bacterium]
MSKYGQAAIEAVELLENCYSLDPRRLSQKRIFEAERPWIAFNKSHLVGTRRYYESKMGLSARKTASFTVKITPFLSNYL